jgi:hypothetical protein
VPPPALVESMLPIPARGLTNLAFPLAVARRKPAWIPARDARALLSDCVDKRRSRPAPVGSAPA